jgi:hypothetical protein
MGITVTSENNEILIKVELTVNQGASSSSEIPNVKIETTQVNKKPVGRPKKVKEPKVKVPRLLKKTPAREVLESNKIGRPKGSRKKPCGVSNVKMLRLKAYTNVLADNGQIISATADQYGRVMEAFINDKNEHDIRPTGVCIAAYH